MKTKKIKFVGNIERGKIATRLYNILLCVGGLFLLQMTLFQNVELFQLRTNEGFEMINNKVITEVIDSNTPLGIKKEYRFNLGEISPIQNYLSFYVVHQYVEVFFDGELMYRLNLQEGNKIGKTTASNWVMIPLYAEDEGKDVCINVIPIYDAVRDREVNFSISSKFMIYSNQLKKDLPQILLSLIAMIVGIVFVITSRVHKYKGTENVNLNYLGIFSFAIGLWKLTDIRLAPLMFPQNTAALSYISITMLLIATIPLILSIRKQLINKSYYILEWSSIVASVAVMVILMLQITNIADLRETLWMGHLVILFVVVTIIGTVTYEVRKNRENKKVRILKICLMICGVGAIMDMLTYYIRGNSSGILFTLISFLIYIITMGYLSITEINHKANIDMHTGLFNKGRCKELLDENEVIQGKVGVIVFDLNRLKYVNDTFGHESGDLLISEFANILRRNISGGDFLGRYGGDEFIAVIKASDKKQLKQVLVNISQGVTQFNNNSEQLQISYASGYSLSVDYPDKSLRELLKKADKEMYINKDMHRKSDI